MNKILSALTAVKVLEEVDSRVNGRIRVVRDLAWGTYIQADGLTQSGGVVYGVWKTTLSGIKKSRNEEIRNCLILGLGGGTAAQIVRKYWPDAQISGIDIDPIMIELGKKYLGLDKLEVQVQVQDASDFVRQAKSNRQHDLILVDLYQGDKVPEKFEGEKFLGLVLKILTDNGLVIFNRLYYDEKRPLAARFLRKARTVFPEVSAFYPQANVMFICSHN